MIAVSEFEVQELERDDGVYYDLAAKVAEVDHLIGHKGLC